MATDKSIERRLRVLERKYPPRKLDFRAVSFEDLETLERVFSPENSSAEKRPKISKRLVRLITKLESDAQ